MITDPTKVEFLEFCRMVLKGEQPAANLPAAISAARSNLESLKKSFLEHVATLNEQIQEKCKPEIDEAVTALEMHAVGIDIIESWLKDNDRVTLVRGMETVRRALERTNLAFYRYRSSVLASEGPTDMPNYNLFFKLFNEFKEKKIGDKDLRNLIQAARFSVDRALEAVEQFKHVPEVEWLIVAFQKHQESLASLEECISTNEPLEQPLEIFRERCEAIRDLQGPAQIKILGQGPTPSETANRMINISKQIATGRLHPAYFSENLRLLEGEYEFFKQQFEVLQNSSDTSDSDLLKDAFKESKTGMELYEKAINEFHSFQERMDVGILLSAVQILQDAVLKLYNVFKLVSDLADREGKVLCLRCQHYNTPGKRSCEKCGAVLPQMVDMEKDELSGREVRDALLTMPVSENIKKLLEAGDGVVRGNISKPDFEQTIAWMESLIDENVNKVEETRRNEAKKQKKDESKAAAPEAETTEDEAYATFQSGIREMKKGLSSYRKYLESEDANLVWDGSKRILVGANKIYQVGRYSFPPKAQ